MTKAISMDLKRIYSELWEVLAAYETTECYNKIPKHEELDVQTLLKIKFYNIRKMIDTLFLGKQEIADKLHNIVDEVEYFTKKYEMPGVVLRWKQINNQLIYFDASFDLLKELGGEEFLKIQRGLTPFKLQTNLDEALIRDRNSYFDKYKKKCEMFDLDFSEEKLFQQELLNTLSLVFVKDFADILNEV